MTGVRNVQRFVTEEGGFTRSAKQSQQMLLRRLKGDFHKAINFFAVQPVVSRHSQGYAQTLGKDLGPHWEFSEELMRGNYIWGGEGYPEQVPRNGVGCGGRAEWVLSWVQGLFWEGTARYVLHPSPSASWLGLHHLAASGRRQQTALRTPIS